MLLSLPKRDAIAAAKLRFQMVKATPEWHNAPYEERAAVRVDMEGQIDLVKADAAKNDFVPTDMTPELVAFCRKRVKNRLKWGAILAFIAGAPQAGLWLVGMVFLLVSGPETVELWRAEPNSFLVAITTFLPGNPLMALACIVLATLFTCVVGALLLSPLLGVLAPWRLVRHVKRAEKDPEYLLPKIHRF